jgi:hypothetical protein
VSSVKEYGGVLLPSRAQGMGLEMLASILALMAGTIMVSWVAILCGIKAPIEEWSFIG